MRAIGTIARSQRIKACKDSTQTLKRRRVNSTRAAQRVDQVVLSIAYRHTTMYSLLVEY